MENYESLGTVGEGTYGVVLKARHKQTGQLVAIKKFKESDQDEQVRKTALREIRILKQLKHDNIVSLLEVFRRKGKLYLVFEYVDHTILEDLERNESGLHPADVKKYSYQLAKALHFIHKHNIIHRDIKPENLLISKHGVLKLCDFGFARTLARPGAKYTDYVATRWYRSPELLVGDTDYGPAVDIWATGCMLAEILNGLPLFPGESDIDQLYHIMKCFGKITPRHMEIFNRNPLYIGIKLPIVKRIESLDKRFPEVDRRALSFMKKCLRPDPGDRDTAEQLLNHPYFHGAADEFDEDIKEAVQKDKEYEQAQMKAYQQRKGIKSRRSTTDLSKKVKENVTANAETQEGDSRSNSRQSKRDAGEATSRKKKEKHRSKRRLEKATKDSTPVGGNRSLAFPNINGSSNDGGTQDRDDELSDAKKGMYARLKSDRNFQYLPKVQDSNNWAMKKTNMGVQGHRFKGSNHQSSLPQFGHAPMMHVHMNRASNRSPVWPEYESHQPVFLQKTYHYRSGASPTPGQNYSGYGATKSKHSTLTKATRYKRY